MLTLSPANLTATTAAHSRVLVAFCAEFSPHCLALRGELAEAAVALRGAAVLAMVESRYEDEDMRQPIATLSWYEDGTAHPYTGGRLADSITQWVWSRLNASGAARLEATRAKKDELRRLASSSAAPSRPLQSQLGKLRSDMMKWYCAGGQHEDVPPCKVRCRPRRRREAPRTKAQPQPHWLCLDADVLLHDEDEGHLLGRGEEEAAYSAPGGDEEDESGGEEKGEPPPAARAHLSPACVIAEPYLPHRRLRWKLRRGTSRCTRSTAKRCGYRERICGRPSCAAANHALRWQADIPNKNPDVCTNTLLKNLYGKKM